MHWMHSPAFGKPWDIPVFSQFLSFIIILPWGKGSAFLHSKELVPLHPAGLVDDQCPMAEVVSTLLALVSSVDSVRNAVKPFLQRSVGLDLDKTTGSDLQSFFVGLSSRGFPNAWLVVRAVIKAVEENEGRLF